MQVKAITVVAVALLAVLPATAQARTAFNYFSGGFYAGSAGAMDNNGLGRDFNNVIFDSGEGKMLGRIQYGGGCTDQYWSTWTSPISQAPPGGCAYIGSIARCTRLGAPDDTGSNYASPVYCRTAT